jgi:Zn-dependent protease with chaperone function
MKRAILICLIVSSFALVARAQESPLPSPAPTLNVPAAAVNVADPAAATRAWLETVPADKRARSDAYFEGGYWLLLWEFLLSAAISIFLLGSRISARLRDFAERSTSIKALQVMLYSVGFILLSGVLSFPLTVYEGFIREHQYGMATQTFGPWFGEQLIGLAVAVIFFPLFLAVLYWVFRRAPNSWWGWGTAVVVVASMIGNFIFPVFVAPLFNTYKPITDPAIRDPILAMARANEIPVDQVYEFDASRQTKRISANVAGFMGTTRIALNDNLLKRCTQPEIRQVMAHEMGHYVLNHIMKLTTSSAIFVFIALLITWGTFDKIVQRWGSKWEVGGIADPAGLPLLGLIISTYYFLLTPIDHTNTRTIEREADAFGINTSREPDGFAAVALKLGEYRKLDPGKWEEIIFFDHPSGRARIRMAMDWKAAHLPCGNASVMP